MKQLFRPILAAALLSTALASTPAGADEASNCAVAKTHAALGQQVYGHVFDEAAKFLMREGITFTRYGRETRTYNGHDDTKPIIANCPMVPGQCGADKFDIRVTLDDSEFTGLPSVHFSIKEGAKDTNIGYILIGKMNSRVSRVYHDACSYDTMDIDGHTWFANVSRAQINGNIGDRAYIGTSLSQVGSTIARGYTPHGIQVYQDETLLIRIEDFGTGERFERFMALTEPLQVSGIIMKFR